MKTTDIFSEDMDLKPQTYNERPDHEVQMARSDLYKAGKYAIELHNMLKRVGEQQGLEGWVQAKITKAADYLESVYHYLDYEMKNPSSDVEMEAAPVTPGATPPGQTVTPANSSSRSSAVVPGTKIAQPTPGMVTMSKVDSSGRTQGMPVKVPQSQIMMKQQQGLKVIGDSRINNKKPVGETTSAGSVASVAGANGMGMKKKEIGSLFGGTFKQNEAANRKQQAAIAIAKQEKDESISEGIVDDKIDAIMAKYGERRRGNIIHEIRLGEYIEMKAHGIKNVIAARNKALDVILQNGVRYYTDLNMKYHQQAEKAAKARGETYNHSWSSDQSGYGRSKGYDGIDLTGVKEGKKTGPKFTGYYKGTDKGKPSKKMVGDA